MVPPKDRKSLRIGVMMEAVQTSDITGIDLFGNLSYDVYSKVLAFDPSYDVYDSEVMDMEFLYLASTLEPATSTPNLRFVPTHTYDNCPRDLDIVIIGGPFLDHRPASADRFMKEAWAKTRVWITTCTGSIWLASSGVLDGHKCTTNRHFLAAAKTVAPGVEWIDQRWVVDDKPFEGDGKGELWTSGGAGAGKKFPERDQPRLRNYHGCKVRERERKRERES